MCVVQETQNKSVTDMFDMNFPPAGQPSSGGYSTGLNFMYCHEVFEVASCAYLHLEAATVNNLTLNSVIDASWEATLTFEIVLLLM